LPQRKKSEPPAGKTIVISQDGCGHAEKRSGESTRLGSEGLSQQQQKGRYNSTRGGKVVMWEEEKSTHGKEVANIRRSGCVRGGQRGRSLRAMEEDTT